MLDNTVWHLVTTEMGALGEQAARRVAMPIFEDSEKFAAWAAQTRSCVLVLGDPSSAIHQRVAALQPFAGAQAHIGSVTPLLAMLMGVEVERAHPLLLLQGYSNLDKHRSIAMMVGRTLVTTGGTPLTEQDRTFRPLEVGTVLTPDATWGSPVSLDSNAAVMVERPSPYTAAVSPITELQLLRDWVGHEALPKLLTESGVVATSLPVSIPLGDTGQTLRERATASDHIGADARIAARGTELLNRSYARPVKSMEVVDEEFED